MKFGFDVHGVLDTHSELYAHLTTALAVTGHEIHVITGAQKTPELEEKLFSAANGLGIKWTHWFSIVQHHLDKGDVEVKFVNGQPWMDREVWNYTKAEYCEEVEIDMMIDDSPIYGSYFTGKCLYLLQKDQKAQETWMTLAGRI